MFGFKFNGLLQNADWIAPAYVGVDDQGRIRHIATEAVEGQKYEEVDGFALPGMQNAHSHAFQYAMVGLTERHDLQKNPDDFWGWREAMYQLALNLNPDQIEAIATMLYSEMLRHGYTSVAEFHYLHHDKTGKPYDNIAELGERLIAAAKRTGIKITLLPVFYQKGGFGRNAEDNQKRFLSSSIEAYLRLVEASKKATLLYQDANIGYAVHSLRAVDPSLVIQLSNLIDPNLPFHLHIAEQKKEVEGALQFLGMRPVEWLLNHVDLNTNYHLVHATHMTPQEAEALAKSKAYVVLCPSTEGNLGDGLFPLQAFQEKNGMWSVGTDSHIGLNPFEELRILDYGQRVTTHRRNSFYDQSQGDSGLYALNKMLVSGRKAMANSVSTFFAIGQPFDALIMDATHPMLATSSLENLASTIVYGSDVSMQLGTIVNGMWVVKNGAHIHAPVIKEKFINTFEELQYR